MGVKNKGKTEDDRIYAVYLYYFESPGSVKIYEWWDPGNALDTPKKVRDRIETLVKNASGTKNYPPYYTNDPDIMMMRRRSYLAFSVKSSDYDDGIPSYMSVSGKNNFGEKIPSTHTFQEFDGFTVVDGVKKHYVVYCKNLMASYFGGKLRPKEAEEFRFRLPFTNRRSGGTREPDSGGTNMGPPVPPPERRKKASSPKPLRA